MDFCTDASLWTADAVQPLVQHHIFSFVRSAKANKRKSLKEKKHYYAYEGQICAEYEINCSVCPIQSFPVPVSLDDMIITMHVGS